MNAATGLSSGDLLRVLGVVVIWGLNFVVMKMGLHTMNPMLLGALRFCVAALPFTLFVSRPNLPWRYIAGYGLAQGLGQFGFLFLGLKLGMTAGMASVVMQMQAFFTLLLALPLLQERARMNQWLGLVVGLVGLLCIVSAHGQGPGQMTLAGFILTLSASFMWALSNLVARLASRVSDYEPFPFIVWSSLFPIVPFVIMAWWMEGSDQMMQQIAHMDLKAWFSVVYLGLAATLLAYSLWTRLLKRHPTGRITPFSLLVPVVGLWAAWFFYGETPLAVQWLGIGLVLLGLVVNQLHTLPRGLLRARS